MAAFTTNWYLYKTQFCYPSINASSNVYTNTKLSPKEENDFLKSLVEHLNDL